MHARQYSAWAGRFLSVDPVLDLKRSAAKPQMWNRYSYVFNNPVRFTDPDGKVALVDDLIYIGAGALAVTAYLAAPSATYPGKNNGQALAQSAADAFTALGAAIGVVGATERKPVRQEQPAFVIGETMLRVEQAAPQIPVLPLPGITDGGKAAAQSVIAVQTAITAGARIFDAGFNKDKKGLSPAYVAEIVTLRQNGYSPHRYKEVSLDGAKVWIYEWRKDLK